MKTAQLEQDAVARLEALAIAKEWNQAVKYLDGLGAAVSALDKQWLVRHVRSCAGHLAEFEQTILPPSCCKQRVESAVPSVRWRGVHVVRNGKMNLALLRHAVEAYDGPKDVLEKIYIKERDGNFRSCKILLSNPRSAGLLAPAFLGSYSCRSFRSIFMSFVEGSRPSSRQFTELMFSGILPALWRSTEMAAEVGESAPFAEKLEPEAVIQRFSQYHDLAGRAGSYSKLRRMLVSHLETSTVGVKVILHGDLHPDNVLLNIVGEELNSLRLLDWDKWHLSKIGFGVRVVERSRKFLERFDAMGENEAFEISKKEICLNAVAWNVHKFLPRKPESAQLFLDWASHCCR